MYIAMSLILAFAFKRLSKEEGGEKDSRKLHLYPFSPTRLAVSSVRIGLGKTHSCVLVRKGVTLLNTIHIHNGIQMRGLVT